MPGNKKKKFEQGEGAQFYTRAMALRKLQLSLKDFRRLCILKGIYPREPRNRKKAQKGDTSIKTLYHKKDIQFLLHDPIVWTIREMKVHGKRIGRAKSMKQFALVKSLLRSRPTMKIDHIVKERYPTFIDALRDLDDCLTLCFLFSTFPSLRHVDRQQSILCRRLTLEFMHLVIAAKALRKVFISIKGYYFQIELRGQTITWIMPHQFGFAPQSKDDVDFKIMSTFVQFYIIMLGFVNFRLYHLFNLHYPPKFTTDKTYETNSVIWDEFGFISERVASLNVPLTAIASSGSLDEKLEIDKFNISDDSDKFKEAQIEEEKVEKLKQLFKELKIFLNREVPREPLTFVLRCFGAEVSFDKSVFIGATFDESDETITHQIADRDTIQNQYLSRYYVQPQWVFDSVNARELLPVDKYLIGCVLPPHLSPFIDHTRLSYVPPELKEEVENIEVEDENVDGQSTDESENEVQQPVAEDKRKLLKKKMKVKPGKIAKENPSQKKQEEYQQYKLREKMVEKKYRGLYKGMMKGRRERMRDIKLLQKKRKKIDQSKQLVQDK